MGWSMKGKGRWGNAGRDDNTKDLKNSWETTEEASGNTARCIHKEHEWNYSDSKEKGHCPVWVVSIGTDGWWVPINSQMPTAGYCHFSCLTSRTWRFYVILEDTTYPSHRRWRNQAGIDLQSLTQLFSFIVLEDGAMHPTRGEKSSSILSRVL